MEGEVLFQDGKRLCCRRIKLFSKATKRIFHVERLSPLFIRLVRVQKKSNAIAEQERCFLYVIALLSCANWIAKEMDAKCYFSFKMSR